MVITISLFVECICYPPIPPPFSEPSRSDTRWRLWCQIEGQIPQRDFFLHALNIYGTPALLGSLASQAGGGSDKPSCLDFKGRLNTDTSPQNFWTTFLENDLTEKLKKSAVANAIAIPLPLCFSCFVLLRRFQDNLTKPFYFYLSRTRGSPCGTPSVIRLVLKGGSTRSKITWVQQRQHHRAQESARERMLSLLLIAMKFEQFHGDGHVSFSML